MRNYFRQRHKQFTRHPVGERFQRRHAHVHQVRRSWANRAMLVLGGGLLLMAGLLMLFTPGPGLLVFTLGGILLAEESLIAAKCMDWCDLRMRALIRLMTNRWKRNR